MNPKPVIAVCGFGRCGSSLLMQMLNAGGIETTGEYPAFEDEHADPGDFDRSWFADQAGKAVKVLDPHKSIGMDGIPHVAIWIDRDVAEQAKSHAKFLRATIGIDMSRATRKAVESSFRRERPRAMRCAHSDQDRIFRTTFEQLIEAPAAVLTVLSPWLAAFGFAIDAERSATVVWPRDRKCLGYLLEAHLIGSAP